MLLTFTLSGLWHGADWSFVVWGLLHALVMNVEFLFRRSGRTWGLPVRVLQCGMTFLVVSALWVFFRAGSIEEAAYILRHSLWGIGEPLQYCRTALAALNPGVVEAVFLAGALLVLFLFDLADEKGDGIALVSGLVWPVRWCLYLGLTLVILVFGVYGPGYSEAAFIYFAF